MVSSDDVRAAYQFILGREPENDDVVSEHARRYQSIADLRASLLASEEFLLGYQWPRNFRGPAEAHSGDQETLLEARRTARKFVQNLISRRHWFRVKNVRKKRQRQANSI